MKTLKDFLTDSAKENIANTIYVLMNNWEEDRMALECEACFNLYDKEDFKLWVDMYGIDFAIKCYQTSQFWIGGCNYATCPAEKAKTHACCVVTPMEMNEKDLNWILGEIEDRVEYNLNAGNTIENCEKIYSNLLNLKGYFSQVANKDIEDYIRDIYAPCGEFDMVDMNILLDGEKTNGDGDKIQFYWVCCNRDGEACDYDYSCIKVNGKIYLPVGERDEYPLKISDIWKYKWVSKNDEENAYLFFDMNGNYLHEDEQKIVWAVDDMLGKDYLPNFLEYDDTLEKDWDGVLQEFTITLWEKYKDHIADRNAFLKYCKDCALHFISLYNHTNFWETGKTYYEYVDNYIDKMCGDKKDKSYTISQENWYC